MPMTDEEMSVWKLERMAAITEHLRGMSHQRLLYYCREIALQVVIAAADMDDTDWPAELHLGDFIEKHLARFMPKWISVADELPTEGVSVLGWTGRAVETVRYYAEGTPSCWFFLDDNADGGNITHWMPLPCAPPA
jgi:hypothetical protein